VAKKRKHWRSGREHLILKRGELLDYPEFKAWFDERSGESFLVRMVNGRPQPKARVKPWKWLDGGEYEEETYDEQQVELIKWALWAYDTQGWGVVEIYNVLRRFWIYLPGQTPLVSRTITSWLATRVKLNRQGKEWP
jgi:hypothetical protein